jgi:hypothetical protein
LPGAATKPDLSPDPLLAQETPKNSLIQQPYPNDGTQLLPLPLPDAATKPDPPPDPDPDPLVAVLSPKIVTMVDGWKSAGLAQS